MRRARQVAAFLLTCALVAASGSAPALTFTRQPWLSLQTPTSILVTWQTDLASSGAVLYGPEPIDWTKASQVTSPGAVTDHAMALSGLAPGTRYRYKVVSGTDTLDAGSFRAAPATSAPFRFLAFGDLGTATADQRLIAARVDSLNADLAILPGDIVYDNGEPWNYTPYYFDIYRPTLKRIPFYPVLGNHDTYYDGGASFVSAFYLPTNFAAGPERSYSFDYANAHFVAIEVTVENTAPPAALTSWLDADLAASSQRWKFVYFHVPMYSNGGGHGGDAIIAAALEPILRARGVDLVFQGHNHFYTRTYPIAAGQPVSRAQDPTYFNPGGPIYIVTGGGGRALYALTAPTSLEALSRSVFHVTAVDVAGDSLMLRAVQEDGTVFDWMTVRKGTTTRTEEPPGTYGAPFAIRRPRPNPAAGFADLSFTLSAPGPASIAILDVRGNAIRVVEWPELGPGEHAWRWDGRDGRGRPVASGRYFVELHAGTKRTGTAITLVR